MATKTKTELSPEFLEGLDNISKAAKSASLSMEGIASRTAMVVRVFKKLSDDFYQYVNFQNIK